MRQIYGMKANALIRGGLSGTDEKKSNPYSDARLSVEKSAEVIVPQKREGPDSNSKTLTDKRIIQMGYDDILIRYNELHSNY